MALVSNELDLVNYECLNLNIVSKCIVVSRDSKVGEPKAMNDHYLVY